MTLGSGRRRRWSSAAPRTEGRARGEAARGRRLVSAQGERDRRLLLLTQADIRSRGPRPDVTKVATGHLGTGLRVLHRRQDRDTGQLRFFLAYAFRVEEHKTDLQIFTATPNQLALTAARSDIERLVQGITVYRNTEERRVAEPG